MKRLVFSILTIFALTVAGAAVAQGPNTSVPGPTKQQEPGLNSNDLPNPGNPLPLQEPTTTMPETETGTGVDVDVDTGSNAEGLVDVDVNSTTDADTDASGIDETGSLDNETDTVSDSLPATATNLPLVGLIGLLALGAALVVRRF